MKGWELILVLNKSVEKQDKMILTTLEKLMPEDHFLRDLENTIDFSFIYEKVESLYSHTGRPSVDPVVLIKMLLLGFLYGIDSERKIEKEAEINIAFHWFLGIDLDERVPDHSTISQTRRRKFKDTNIFEEIFDEVVKRCIDTGLVDGKLILTDSTHIKANASIKRKETVTVTVEPRAYMKKLEEYANEEDLRLRADAIAQGKGKRGRKPSEAPKTKTIELSTTDPESGILNRPGKPGGFHYLNHQSVDGKNGIITDVYVTAANINDFEPYVGRIKYQKEKYGLEIKEVGIDKGYDYTEVHKELYDMSIQTYTPIQDTEKATKDKVYGPSDFKYDDDKNAFICPAGRELKYSSISKSNMAKVYRASQKHCKNCPCISKCIGGKAKVRTVEVALFKEEADLQRSLYGTKRYYEVQRLRKIYCEGNFAIQKENYNLRRTRKRGIANVTEHCLLSAIALNMKRLVRFVKSQPKQPVSGAVQVFYILKRVFGV